MTVTTKSVRTGTECRQCCGFCDKLIEPRRCIEMSCPYLYSYEHERTGRSYVGCLQKVFRVEIDLEMLARAERTRRGFGGIKASREPLPICPMTVERSYEGKGPAFECSNPRFFDVPEVGPGGYRAFDLRVSLPQER